MRKRLLLIVAAVLTVCLCALGLYFTPPVHERLAWRVDESVLKVKYSLNPPAKAVFVPQQAITTTAQISSTTSEALETSSLAYPTIPAASATSQEASATPMPTLTSTSLATPLPDWFELRGVHYQDQHGRLNYCAPANLAMALSFWGWEGDRDLVGPFLKPDVKDKNVMPYEMVDYIETQTDLGVVYRVGGDIDLLKSFIAAGYPVLVEKGTYLRDLTGVVSWMGHYQVLTGYDEADAFFTAQDSYVGPDHQITNEDLIDGWRSFNYTYLVVYPPEDEALVMSMLGSDADETSNYQNAAQKASEEIYATSGIEQYFAWFNRGTNLVNLQDYAGAATAYDEAFAIYPTIPENERPWRMLWYSTGPYFAYYYSGRHYDTLYLADGTLNAMQSDRNLEESYYWRGMARAALGDREGAIEDFQTSLQFHTGFEPAIYQLNLLGVEIP